MVIPSKHDGVDLLLGRIFLYEGETTKKKRTPQDAPKLLCAYEYPHDHRA